MFYSGYNQAPPPLMGHHQTESVGYHHHQRQYSSHLGSSYLPNNNYDMYNNGQLFGAQNQPPAPVHQVAQNNNKSVSNAMSYDIETMVDFVCVMTHFKTPSSLSSVLYATNLPETTIFGALIYYNQLVDPSETDNDYTIFTNLVLAFMVSNKYMDDQTFTNRSWSNASGLPIELLNSMERDWLNRLSWNLSINERYNQMENIYFNYLSQRICSSSVNSSYMAAPVSYNSGRVQSPLANSYEFQQPPPVDYYNSYYPQVPMNPHSYQNGPMYPGPPLATSQVHMDSGARNYYGSYYTPHSGMMSPYSYNKPANSGLVAF
ncbi:hypothetical protein LJB42_001112 [Komagataella kurtzmanii]|nr:hypothetical protein LJB42_001112 [Komagataella kurtzmanii]